MHAYFGSSPTPFAQAITNFIKSEPAGPKTLERSAKKLKERKSLSASTTASTDPTGPEAAHAPPSPVDAASDKAS